MNITRINTLSAPEARAELRRCCGAARWVDTMTARRPFADADDVRDACEAAWLGLTDADWQEAFAHHPKIGDLESLRARFGSTAAWASGEQAGTATASEETLRALAEGNATYEARFGYIFIVCATGKSADEMLDLLRARLSNDPIDELAIAANEQKKITRLRLEKL